VFVSAQSVGPAAIHLNQNAVNTGEIRRVAPIAPRARSVIGAGKRARVRPSRAVFDRRVVARNAPPAVERPFAARKQQLQNNPGLALEPGATEPSQRSDTNTARNVRVIDEQHTAVDTRAAGSRRADKTTQLRPLVRQAAERQQREQRQHKDEKDKKIFENLFRSMCAGIQTVTRLKEILLQMAGTCLKYGIFDSGEKDHWAQKITIENVSE
jgi:hypothetical protein